MDNRIHTPVSPVLPRQAEQADTRLGLRHYDPEQQRRHKDREDDKDSLSGDVMEVSIEALIKILQDYLQQHKRGADPLKRAFEKLSQKAANAGAFSHPYPSSEKSYKAARAANAYASQANLGQPKKKYEDPGLTADLENKMTTEEGRRVQDVLRNLETLLQQGFTHLPVDQTGSFLVAIEKAALQLNKAS